MEYYSTVNKNGIMSFAGKWVEPEKIILCEIIQTRKEKCHMFCHWMFLVPNLQCFNFSISVGGFYLTLITQFLDKRHPAFVSIISPLSMRSGQSSTLSAIVIYLRINNPEL